MSDNTPQREMTLKEWMARLPATHTANVELAALGRELAEAQHERNDAERDLFMVRDELKACRAEVERAARWFYSAGIDAEAGHDFVGTAPFDDAWSRYTGRI